MADRTGFEEYQRLQQWSEDFCGKMPGQRTTAAEPSVSKAEERIALGIALTLCGEPEITFLSIESSGPERS